MVAKGALLCVLPLLLVSPASAQEVKEFDKQVTEFSLPNGLQFLLLERHDSPVVSFHTYVRVGSADDITGHTGLAYLLDRVALSGTDTIGSKNWPEERKALDAVEEAYDHLEGERNLGVKASPERLDKLNWQVRMAIDSAERFSSASDFTAIMEDNGASRIALSTTPDASECTYSLPSNRIELWFLMESQRLMHPVFRDFYKTRNTLVEERQKPPANSAQVRMQLANAFLAAAFAAHPYRNPQTGFPGDLANLRRTDARAFIERYYVPSNVVIAMVGDVNQADARRLAQKYFGAWASKTAPPLIHTQEPPQPGPRTVVMESPAPAMLLEGYKRPSQFDKDDPVLDLLQIILTEGRNAMLAKELITDKHVAQRVQAVASFPASRYPSVFLFGIDPAQGRTVEENQRALEDFLNRLKLTRIDENTMARARTFARVAIVNRMTSNAGTAGLLALFQGTFGNWRQLFQMVDEYNKITAADIQRVLLRYFIATGRTTAYTVAPGQSGNPPVQKPAQPTGGKQ